MWWVGSEGVADLVTCHYSYTLSPFTPDPILSRRTLGRTHASSDHRLANLQYCPCCLAACVHLAGKRGGDTEHARSDI